MIPRLRSSSGRRSGRLTSFVRLLQRSSSQGRRIRPRSRSNLPGNANFTRSPAIIILITHRQLLHAPRPSSGPRHHSGSHNRYTSMLRFKSKGHESQRGALGEEVVLRAFGPNRRHNQSYRWFGAKSIVREGLTLRSTRTLPARSSSTSHGSEFSSSLNILSPAGPVNFFR